MILFQLIMLAATIIMLVAHVFGNPDISPYTKSEQRFVWALQLIYLLVQLFMIILVIKIQN